MEGDKTKICIMGDDGQIKKAEELILDLTCEREQFSAPKYDFGNDKPPPPSEDAASFDWRALSASCVTI